ncbi:MAG: IS1595 family transposase [Pseudomonadota bacterium]
MTAWRIKTIRAYSIRSFRGLAKAKKNKGSSLIAFQQRFATEQACIEHLAALRWPDGYSCRKCGGDKAYQLKMEPRVFMCSHCNFQESVTAGTLLHRTKLPLVKWFWAAYMLAQNKRGVLAMHVSRELNLRYATAWTMLHKLRRALADNGGYLLGGVVEVDETYYGGKGGPGSARRSLANENKALIVMAVELKPARKDQVLGIKKTCFVVGSAKVAMIVSAAYGSIGAFIRDSLSLGTNMLTDGWSGYFTPGQDFKREPTVQGIPANAKRILPLVQKPGGIETSGDGSEPRGSDPSWGDLGVQLTRRRT